MSNFQEFVKAEINNEGILIITLNRPSTLNALDINVLTHLQDIFITAKSNHVIKALMITGEGKAFCAGADINQLSTLNSQTGLEFSRHGQKIFNLLEEIGKPSLAAINGPALGGGCELASAATLRIASNTALFGQPEIKLGILPGFGGTQRLSRLIGKGRTLDLCLSGRTISAETALEWGLISEMTSPEELLNKGRLILNGLIKLSPLALKSMMTTINQGFNLTLNEALELEAAHFGLCCATRDKEEGVKAFLEKRTAIFIGE